MLTRTCSKQPIDSQHSHRLDLALGVVLFVLALFPRVLGLSAFLTVDEPAWIMRSAHFAQALLEGDPAGTLQTNHPGITTTWTGALGLAAYYFVLHPGAGGGTFPEFLAVAGDPYLTADLLAAVRFPTALLAAACVTVAYFLLRRTFGRTVSALAAALIALDPFFITYARVLHHDALASMFVLVAVLALVTYLVAEPRTLYAGIAGIATGLAWLSKASTLFLGPFGLALFVIVFLVRISRSERGTRTPWLDAIPGVVVWGVAAGITFFVLWPALWTIPLDVVRTLFGASAELAESGHLQFFRGEIATDAGAMFYPVIFAFRTTPVTLAGFGLSLLYLVLAPALGTAQSGGHNQSGRQRAAVALFWLFTLVFAIFITLSPKKQDRYLLPVFPFVDICAAAGILGTLHLLVQVADLRHARWDRRLTGAVLGLCVAFTLVTIAWYHPYAISYYNPLAGGPAAAQRDILIGWGEGMDAVGAYLNDKTESAALTVAAVPYRTLIPYFKGHVTDYLTSNAPVFAADYVVAYISQTQRKGPNIPLWEYLQQQTPEATLQLHGIDYARIYRGARFLSTAVPQSMQTRVDADFGGRIRLIGYDAQAGQGHVTLELFWQTLQDALPNYSVSVRLKDRAGHYWARQEGEWIAGLLPTSQSAPRYVVRDPRTLPLPAGMPEGRYTLELYVYNPVSGEDLALVDPDGTVPAFGLEAGTLFVPKQTATRDDVSPQVTVDEAFADGVRLIGYDLLETQAAPGGTISPVLYWLPTKPMTVSYAAVLRLETESGAVLGTTERPVAGGEFPTIRWQVGDVVRDWQSLPIPPDAPSGSYPIAVALHPAGSAADDWTHSATLGMVTIAGRAHHFEAPPGIQHATAHNFAGLIDCIGYDLDTTGLASGQSLRLILYWRARTTPPVSYKTFVHVIGPDGQVWAQHDTIPLAGEAPTTGWLGGEVIADAIALERPSDAPPGRYEIRVGWYDESTGQRLNVLDGNGTALGDFVTLGDGFVIGPAQEVSP